MDRSQVCGVIDWGLIPYPEACAWQRELVQLRKAGRIPDLVVLCHHPHIITLGRRAHRDHVLLSEKALAEKGVELHPTNRGGDVTYHGPGQLVGYPIVDLAGWHRDVVRYVRALEEVLIRAVAEFGISSRRKTSDAAEPTAHTALQPLYTGVWVDVPGGGEEKLAAIGVHISRWVTSHGFALNVTTDLRYFDLIVPCGIADRRVTSLERLLGPSGWGHEAVRQRPGRPGSPSARRPPLRERGSSGFQPGEGLALSAVKRAVVEQFGEVFDRTMTGIPSEQWEEWVGLTNQATAS